MKSFSIKKGHHLFAAMFLFCFISMQKSNAQQFKPFGAAYFQNGYLFNPALAGYGQGVNLNAGYRRETEAITGSPTSQYFTADYGVTDKNGVGLQLLNDEAGVIRTTRVMGTYSYHISFTEKRKLHLGISAGIWNRQLDLSKTNGEIDDPALTQYNERGVEAEADFGAAYTHGNLTVGAAMPNMISHFNKSETDVVNKPVFFASAGYRFQFNEDNDRISLEPKVFFRSIKGNDHLVDAGANLSLMNEQLNFFALYHNTENVTIGAGLLLKKSLRLLAVYSSGSSAMKGYNKGSFEVGLGFSFLKRSEK